MKEQILRLPNDGVVTDEGTIRKLLHERQILQNQRNSTPPSEVVRGIDLSQVTFERVTPSLVGTIETSFDAAGSPFRVPLCEIPDITVDLTPEAGELPRNAMCFTLDTGTTKISIRVYFNDTVDKYWDLYGQDDQIEAVVKNDLLAALSRKKWQLAWYNAWVATG